MPQTPSTQDGGTPGLLLTFVAATLMMLVAIVEIARTDSDWAEAAAIVLLLGLLALLIASIARMSNDDEP